MGLVEWICVSSSCGPVLAVDAYTSAKRASPYQVTLDSHRLKPPQEEALDTDGNFVRLTRELNRVFYTLVVIFDYPIHVTTLDVAYRAITYQQHPEYARNTIAFIAYSERQGQVHYIKSDYVNSRGQSQSSGTYWLAMMGERCFFSTKSFQCHNPPGADVPLPQGFRVVIPETILTRMAGKCTDELVDGIPVATHRQMQKTMEALAGLKWILRRNTTAMRSEIYRFYLKVAPENEMSDRKAKIPIVLQPNGGLHVNQEYRFGTAVDEIPFTPQKLVYSGVRMPKKLVDSCGEAALVDANSVYRRFQSLWTTLDCLEFYVTTCKLLDWDVTESRTFELCLHLDKDAFHVCPHCGANVGCLAVLGSDLWIVCDDCRHAGGQCKGREQEVKSRTLDHVHVRMP